MEQWFNLQERQQEALAEHQRLEMQSRGQTPSKSPLLQQLRGFPSRKKRFRERSTSTLLSLHGSSVTPQQQLHALLGLRVPVAPLGPTAAAQTEKAANAARTLASRTRQVGSKVLGRDKEKERKVTDTDRQRVLLERGLSGKATEFAFAFGIGCLRSLFCSSSWTCSLSSRNRRPWFSSPPTRT